MPSVAALVPVPAHFAEARQAERGMEDVKVYRTPRGRIRIAKPPAQSVSCVQV
jgi:hypothetical protein